MVENVVKRNLRFLESNFLLYLMLMGNMTLIGNGWKIISKGYLILGAYKR